jgi:SAM-dependent methyltransferase
MRRLLLPLAALAGRRTPKSRPLAAGQDLDVRRQIGDAVLEGHGYEFGAGLLPSRFAKVEGLTVVDKRTTDELEVLFGRRPDYPVRTPEAASARPAADFVTAHHVLEHLPDPIGTLADWLRLLRLGGALYLSIPSSNNPYERLREVTPIRHLVLDYVLGADGADFESRQHVQSFIQQWTAVSPDSFWFTRDGVQAYAKAALAEQRRTDGHDLHWHTYSLETFMQVIEIAFHVAGAGLAWGPVRETEGELHAVAYRTAEPVRPPFLSAIAAPLQERLQAFAEPGHPS